MSVAVTVSSGACIADSVPKEEAPEPELAGLKRRVSNSQAGLERCHAAGPRLSASVEEVWFPAGW
jgi:hypothetical protein